MEDQSDAKARSYWAPHLLQGEVIRWTGQPDLRRVAWLLGLIVLILLIISGYYARAAVFGASLTEICGLDPRTACLRGYQMSNVYFWTCLAFLVVFGVLAYRLLDPRTRPNYAVTSFRILAKSEGLFTGLVALRLAEIRVEQKIFSSIRFKDQRQSTVFFAFLSKTDAQAAYGFATQKEGLM